MVLGPVLALLLAVPLHAQPPAPSPVQAGADIATFRAVTEAALSPEARLESWTSFVVAFPRSPLAEIALARCLSLGADALSLLERIAPIERAQLVASFRAHHELLLSEPPEGPALGDAASAASDP